MNALCVIFPYRLEGVWVFDDTATGLVREPFISGADNILALLAEHIPNVADRFKIVFSARPFPGYTAQFVWTRAEYGVRRNSSLQYSQLMQVHRFRS